MFMVLGKSTIGAEYCLGIYDDKTEADAHAAGARRKWTSIEVQEMKRVKTHITSTVQWTDESDEEYAPVVEEQEEEEQA